MENVQIKANGLDFGHIGWKYYYSIRKKAMEQEFSYSGLFISLSIAFFIVILTACMLSFFYGSLDNGIGAGFFRISCINRFA